MKTNGQRSSKPVVQSYRHTVHASTGLTPFFTMHGWEPPPPMLSTLVPPVSADHPIKDYVSNLRSNTQVAWDSATSMLSKNNSRNQAKMNKSHKRFDVPLGSLVYVRLPPNKGQSQGFQSFTSGLCSFRLTILAPKIALSAEGIAARKTYKHKYVFPFTAT